MQRHNAFNQIHKALRAMLYDAALSLQQTDFACAAACDAAVEKIVALLYVFDEHAHHEDNHILPALERFEPSVVDAFEQEHVLDLQLSRALQATVADLYRTRQESEKVRLGKHLTRTFIQFMIFNLNHMAKEEAVLNELLWRYYSDAEIKKIEAVIRQNVPPEKQPFIATWMLRGISNSEAVSWLMEMQQHAPAAVFQQVFAIAKAEWPADRFEQLAAHFQTQAAFA